YFRVLSSFGRFMHAGDAVIVRSYTPVIPNWPTGITGIAESNPSFSVTATTARELGGVPVAASMTSAPLRVMPGRLENHFRYKFGELAIRPEWLKLRIAQY